MRIRLDARRSACGKIRRDVHGSATAVGVLRFGVFELDPAAPELRRNGRRVHLQEMPLQVLQLLLERPNELVPREAFFTRLWPHDHSGILDDNLNTAIRKLRLALDDSAHHPRFIETVPKRGYRFVAAVIPDAEAAAEPAAAGSSPPSPSPPSAKRRVRMIVIAPLIVAVIAATAVALILSNGSPGEPAVATPHGDLRTLAVLPFANAGGAPGDAYFSDGLTEELMDRLSRTGRVRVVSRTSAFAWRGGLELLDQVVPAKPHPVRRCAGSAALVLPCADEMRELQHCGMRCQRKL